MAQSAKTRVSSTPVLLGRQATQNYPVAKSEVFRPNQSSSRGFAYCKEQGFVEPPWNVSGERPGSSGSGDSVRSAGQMIVASASQGQAAKNSTTKASGNVSRRSSSAAAAKPAGRVVVSREARQREMRAAREALEATAPAEVVAAPEPEVVIDREASEAWRAAVVSSLVDVPDFRPADNDPRAFHGRALCFDGASFPEPRVVWKSSKKPRQNSPDWLTATEYADTAEVFAAKVRLLREMLQGSRRTMAYTGAGLSVAAGIGMAAEGSSGGAGTGMGVATAGEPTISHCVMAELNRQNLLHGWVQQNHDGLPQKAGYRQEDINEVHGSWFDPSNPVVKYSGSLRGDLFDDLEDQADSADLVIVMGTSLTGLNADQCVRKTAQRSTVGAALGSVIISPQRTAQDGKAALRIFAKADDVMVALAKEFGFGPRAFGKGRGIKRSADLFPKQSRVLVPYDRNGVRSDTVKTYWDLSLRAQIRISQHNNIDGAKQPGDSHITTATVGQVTGRNEKNCCIDLTFGGSTKKLGLWWLETAKRGGLQYLPVVNVDAKEISVAADGCVLANPR